MPKTELAPAPAAVTTTPLLAVESATVFYGSGSARVEALSQVSLAFEPGRLTLIMGPSGSGKTTLLSVLGCLLRPDKGRVLVNGQDASALREARRTDLRRENIGFIFQAFRLFHSLNSLQNVLLSAEIAGLSPDRASARARQLLTELGMAEKIKLRPKELSGGEKQRIAIARALLLKPKVILADEPTASLDSKAGYQICGILRGLAEQQHHTVVVVSHDLRWKEFAHRTVVLEDGRVAEDRSSL